METFTTFLVLILGLFFWGCIITIPILIIKLLIKLIKKADYNNNCSNCPYYNQYYYPDDDEK